MPQIQVFRCSSCGASLSYEGGPETSVTCQFCGTSVVIPPELRAKAGPPPAMPPLVPGTAGRGADVQQTGMEAVEQLTRAGKKIEAIKVYRQLTGVGLKEAKEAVEGLEVGGQLPPRPERVAANQPDMAAVEQLAHAGKKIEAIKVYRQLTGVGLKEAKDAVEALEAGGSPPPRPESPATIGADMAAVEQLAHAGQKLEAIKVYRQVTGAGLREAVDAVEAMMGGRRSASNTVATPTSKKRVRRSGNFGCSLMLAAVVAGFYFFVNYLPCRLSGSYSRALTEASTSPAIVKALGEPVEADAWLAVKEWSCSATCYARYTMYLHGPQQKGQLVVSANMRAGRNFFDPAAWSVSGTLQTDGGGVYDIPSARISTVAPRATAAAMATAAPRPTQVPTTAPEQETPTPDLDATATVMQQAQEAWQPTSPLTLAEPFKAWPIGVKRDDAIAVTTTTQAQSYLMTVFPTHSSSYMNFTPLEAAPVQDFVATVDLKFIHGDAANTYAYGLIFRLVNDDYGFFGLQNDGQFRVLLVQDTGIYEKVQETSAAIRTGVGSTNRLEVRNLGSDFVFLINGKRVASLHHDLNPGAVGLGVDVYVKGKPAEVQFSKFSVLVPSP